MTADIEESIQFEFTNFDLQYQSEPKDGKCHENFIEIFDNFLDQDEPLQKYCGRLYTLPTIKTIGHIMSIKLTAGQDSTGFQGKYNIAQCGGVHTGTRGQILSEPRNPKSPRSTETNCESIIKGTDVILIKF